VLDAHRDLVEEVVDLRPSSGLDLRVHEAVGRMICSTICSSAPAPRSRRGAHTICFVLSELLELRGPVVQGAFGTGNRSRRAWSYGSGRLCTSRDLGERDVRLIHERHVVVRK